TFTLFFNGGSTPVDTEVVNVSGDGTYTTPTGFTVPNSGTVTGTYQWNVSYSGDPNDDPATDNDPAQERVTVLAATPAVVTTPNPETVLLGGRLQDVANLVGSYHATGTITFRLYAPGVDPRVGPATYTEVVPGVHGDGTYSTAVGFASDA